WSTAPFAVAPWDAARRWDKRELLMLHLFLQAAMAWSATCGTMTPTGPGTEPSAGEASCTLTAAGPHNARSVTGRTLGPAVPMGPPIGFWNYPTTFCNTDGVTAAE